MSAGVDKYKALAVRAMLFGMLLVLVTMPFIAASCVLVVVVLYYALKYPAAGDAKQCRAQRFSDTLIGHRGCRHVAANDGYLIPENSMFAFHYAALQGADGVELDTRLSADGVPIVMHDANAVRLMYGDNCEVPLESMTVAQIRQLKWKKVAPAANCPRPLPKGFVAAPRLSTAEQKLFDAPVPTLEEVIVFCKEHELKLMIESKEWFRPRQMAKAIAKLFAKHQCYSNMFVASFNPIVLYWIRRENINIETMMLFTNNLLQKQASSGAELFPWWVEAVAPFVDPILSYTAQHVLPDFLGCGLIGAHNLLVCKDMIDSYRQRGIVTDIWVSNEINELRWLHKQSTMVTTDFLFKEYLDTRRAALKDEESKRDQ